MPRISRAVAEKILTVALIAIYNVLNHKIRIKVKQIKPLLKQ